MLYQVLQILQKYKHFQIKNPKLYLTTNIKIMKKIFAIILVSFICLQNYGQLLQASVGIGSQANRIKIYLKSDITLTPSTISTLDFNVGIVKNGSSVTPPILTIITNNIPGAVYTVAPVYSELGYWNYNIYGTSSPVTPSFIAGTEIVAMELEFTNGVPNLGDVGLVTLPDGGTTTGYAAFYCKSSTLNSDGASNLYYDRPPTTLLDNQISYNPGGTPVGTATSSVLLVGITLPVKFVGLTATKKNNTAQLNWQVANENSLTAGYDVERSLNGIDFKKVSLVAPQNNGRSSNSYTSTDDLSTVNAASIVYYRIKQTDKDGNFVYSEIKSVRLDSKAIAASIYPNPVRGKANLSIDLTESTPVTITLNDATGKQVQIVQMKGLKGQNTKEINMSSLPTGNYVLRVLTGTETKTIPVIKGN